MIAVSLMEPPTMPDLTRRETLAWSTLAALAAAAPETLAAQSLLADGGGAFDLTDLYPSDAGWDAARRQALAAVPGMARWKGRLGEGAGTLREALVAQSDLRRAIGRVVVYASLSADADLRVAAWQARVAQTVDLLTAFGEATAWTAPEILTLGQATVERHIAADATLARRFDVALRNILRQAPHTLSTEGEMLLAGSDAPLTGPEDIRGQLISADIAWPSVTLSTGATQRLDDQGYTLVRDAPLRTDRKLVFDTFWGAYGRYTRTLGAAYASHVKADLFARKARRYPTSLAASLAPNAIPEGVYRTLVAETNAALPQLHRYFEIRRRLLKLPDMAYYDIYPPLVTLDRPVPLARMRETVLKAVAPLGPEYGATLARATAARWMDPLRRPGKRPGAYMNPGAYDVHPYLLLNLKLDYGGMSTYAHEWGHAMHSLLANRAQGFDKADYPLFLAEIASTCNEQLLAAHMIQGATTREEKLYYLGQQLETIRGTFFRQTMFAEFELAAHDKAEAGEGLTSELLTATYLDLLKRYHGPKVAIDPAYAAEWAYIPHFYDSFYVYQYATSIAAAAHFSQAILAQGAPARETYLDVLRAGGSDHPVPILRRAGLDMTRPEPYRAIVALFAATMDQVEALIA